MKRPRAHGLAIALAIAVLAGCAAKATPSTPASLPSATLSPTASSTHAIAAELQRIFSDPAVDHAQWSVAVNSLTQGDTLFRLNAQRLQVPASNQKLLTAAAAVEKLGWDYRYTTKIYAAGPIKDGTLTGDLVVTGDGDPTINRRHPDRVDAFDAWAKKLSEGGLRLVAGSLVGDDNAFAEPGWGLGWAWDDIAYGYGAAVGALQYNENQVELMIGPGVGPGDRGILSLSPPGSGLTIDHGLTTVAADAETRISLERIPGSNILSVRGQIAAGAATRFETVGVPNPTQLYLNVFRVALERHGIFVGGNASDIDDLRVGPDLTHATLLLEDRSSPLEDIVAVMLKDSRNEYAETLVRTLAWPENPATDQTGLAVLRETLTKLGVSTDLYLARDGSGLSRYDYVSADALIALLTAEWKSPNAEKFRNALPVSGVSGTIANRMKGTPAEGRVFAKTGSMSQVRSIAGYVMTAENEPMVFAIMVNGFRVPAREIDQVTDKALAALAAFSRLRQGSGGQAR